MKIRELIKQNEEQYEFSAKLVFVCCSFVGLVTFLAILALAITK